MNTDIDHSARASGAVSMYAGGPRTRSTRVPRWCVMGIAVVLSVVTLAACGPGTSGEPSPAESSPAAAWADVLPKGVKVVDRGHSFGGHGSNGAMVESLGAILENTTDRSLVLRVSFAVWSTEDKEPWWETADDRSKFVAIRPGEKVGTGDLVEEPDESGSDVLEKIQVKAAVYKKKQYQGEPVGFSTFAEAEPDKAMKATVEKITEPGETVKFTVDNPYEQEVASIGMGLVLLDADDKAYAGWSYRPGEKVDGLKTRFTPGEYPPGESTHEIALGALGGSADIDESSVQIYVWARA